MIRRAFIETLCELASKDERIWLVCGDLGFNLLEKFALGFPERFVNAGIAEQQMMGMATGLASCGKIVFVYSIANFPTMRCLEQIRNDVCLHQANVKIVTVGGAFLYGPQGVTHQTVEDIAVMRAMPFMSVTSASDAMQASSLTRMVAYLDGPVYLRLGKGDAKQLYDSGASLSPGKMIDLREGDDVLLIATGPIVGNALEAASILARRGVSTAVWDCPWIKPIDAQAITEAALRYRLIVTIEDAHLNGGLGGAVAELVAAMPSARASVKRLGVTDEYMHQSAFTQASAWAYFGLDAAGIVKTIEAAHAS